ncbi:MAG: alpha/beta hydrolase family protein, partial [Caulobacteraceae bacterium]
FWRKALGAEAISDPALAAISPLKFAARAGAPVLLMHGEDDTVVLPAQSHDMEQALKRAGKPVDLMMLPAEDHWLSTEAGRQAVLRAEVAFVLKHNPPD